MSETFLSPDWPNVAQLTPGLRPHLRLHRQVYRKRIWHIIEDETNGRQHRLDESAWQMVSQFNGSLSVNECWENLLNSLKSHAPSQPDVIQLMGFLHQADLIHVETTVDTDELFYRSKNRKNIRRQSMVNPFAFKAPLINPTKLLDKLEPKTRWMFHWLTGTGIVLLTLFSALSAIQNWDEIAIHAANTLPSSKFWIITWFVYPLVKFFHEMAHAVTVRYWGGKVHEIGISLLVLMPVPYVNASAANLFPNKHARMLVSAAGILAEVILASVALFLWLNVSDGWIRDIAFVVMTISGVSTVLFNANPLIKFDGYHFLTDWLEIPDLAKRSSQYWISLSKRYFLKVPESLKTYHASGEAKWLFLYMPLSWGYRWIILIVIAQWMASISLLLAALVSAYFLHALVGKPVWKFSRYLWQSSELSSQRARSIASVSTVVLILVVFISVFPSPFSTVTQAVVWTPDESKIRSSAEGFIKNILVNQGDIVKLGQPLIELKNELLITRKLQLEAKLVAIDARLNAAQQKDRTLANQLTHESKTVSKELALVNRQSEDLFIRSSIAGTVVIPQLSDLQGRFLRQGDTLGYILGDSNLRLRAVIAQKDFNTLNQYPGEVLAQLSTSEKNVKSVNIVQIRPSATYQLPSPALSYKNGGTFLTDPADEQSQTTLSPIFIVDLEAPRMTSEHLGRRIWLRFDHGSKPLLQQWAFHWEQLFIQHFSSQV